MISRVFNPAYVDNIIDWLRTSGIRIVVIIIGAYVLLKLISVLIERTEKVIMKDTGDFFANLETQKRVKTLGNILRKAAFVTVFVLAFMMVLREVGIDIAPIIAGAGIVGLAIGFGAQNLVRDIISGFFIIMENQVRVGDVAVVNGTGGLVEEINLRTIVLRDLQGTVHIFPNGTINTLSNMTRGWSRYVIDVGVAYKENVDEVMQVLKEIGEELYKDEKFRPSILEPLEILGVDNFGSSEVIIKCMIKTQPLKQWDVGRELRRRIKNTFDQKGIEIPFPHVSIYFGERSKPFAVNINRRNDSSVPDDEG
ncbi:MAG: mechanosensitive ion channel protein MscS [Candidatus Dadabacteria bacterium]